MNGLWIMIAVICLGGMIMITEVFKHKVKMDTSTRNSDKACADLADRLEQVEKRLANIESLIVDLEKLRDFDRAL